MRQRDRSWTETVMETVVANPLAAAGDSNTIVMEPSVTYRRNWRTGLNNCNTDEETTWWGSWCCCLLHARTSQSFELDTSQKLVMCYVIYFAGLFLLMSSGLLIPFATAGGLMLVWYRAKMRSMIREKLNISGSFSGDFITHLCCACCAVCQEAREEKTTLPRSIDFCSGEDLLSEDRAHQRAIGHGEEGSGSAIPEVRSRMGYGNRILLHEIHNQTITLLYDK